MRPFPCSCRRSFLSSLVRGGGWGGLCDNAFIVEIMHTNVMCLLLCFLLQIPTDNILFTSLHQLASMASVRRRDSKSKAQLMTARPTLESLRHRCMFPSIIYINSSVALAFGLRDELPCCLGLWFPRYQHPRNRGVTSAIDCESSHRHAHAPDLKDTPREDLFGDPLVFQVSRMRVHFVLCSLSERN